MELLVKTAKHHRKTFIPIHPIVTSRHDMKFMQEMALFQDPCHQPIGRKKTVFVAANQQQVGSFGGIRDSREKQWIIVELDLAVPRTKN